MSLGPSMLTAEALARMQLFRGLAREQLDEVRRRAGIRRLAKGVRIFSQGDPARHCHALVEGGVKIVQTGVDGQQLVVRFIGPGEMFGALALFVDHRYPADALAVNDGLAVNWSEPQLRDLMRRFPDIALNALSVVGERLGEAQNRLRELATEGVERRIAHALLRLARQAGRPAANGTAIDLPLSRQDIAELTGSSLYTVSRILANWEQRGIAKGGRQRVVIADRDAVLDIAVDELHTAANSE